MKSDIERVIEKIKEHTIFEKYHLYFIGGTALSIYLNHRISYDIDITSRQTLPVSDIKAFAFSIDAKVIPDRERASAFRINRGENLENYYMKFMVDGVKLEFSYFDDAIRQSILEDSVAQTYRDSKLKILPLADIITLKAIALFKRQKSRDLFDMAIVLERNFISIEELERIYSFYQISNKSIREYIQSFDISKDDDEDSSLDFLPEHDHYKIFAKLTQDERFDKAKEMFLAQYNIEKQAQLKIKNREVKLQLKRR